MGADLGQMRTSPAQAYLFPFMYSKAIRSYQILQKLSKTPTLPTLLPTVTLRKQAKQKECNVKIAFHITFFSSAYFPHNPAKTSQSTHETHRKLTQTKH